LKGFIFNADIFQNANLASQEVIGVSIDKNIHSSRATTGAA
jgi:hypothetical protein